MYISQGARINLAKIIIGRTIILSSPYAIVIGLLISQSFLVGILLALTAFIGGLITLLYIPRIYDEAMKAGIMIVRPHGYTPAYT